MLCLTWVVLLLSGLQTTAGKSPGSTHRLCFRRPLTNDNIEDHACLDLAVVFGIQHVGRLPELQAHAEADILGQPCQEVLLPSLLQVTSSSSEPKARQGE